MFKLHSFNSHRELEKANIMIAISYARPIPICSNIQTEHLASIFRSNMYASLRIHANKLVCDSLYSFLST